MMPSATRPRRGQTHVPNNKQSRYRISDDDDDDDDDEAASKVSYNNVGGVLASLNRNVPRDQKTSKQSLPGAAATAAAATTTATGKTQPKKEPVKQSIKKKLNNVSTTKTIPQKSPTKKETETIQSSNENTPPLSSVVVRKNPRPTYSPLSPSQSKTKGSQRRYDDDTNDDDCRRRIFNDETSGGRCDIDSPQVVKNTRGSRKIPPNKSRHLPKGQGKTSRRHFKEEFSEENESESDNDESTPSEEDCSKEESYDQGGEDVSEASNSDEDDDDDDDDDATVPIDSGDVEEDEDNEDDEESESDEEFEFEDEEFVPDEDDSDDDDEEISEDDLDDFIEEESPPKKRSNRPQRKVAKTPNSRLPKKKTTSSEGTEHASTNQTPGPNQSVSHSTSHMDEISTNSAENDGPHNSFDASHDGVGGNTVDGADADAKSVETDDDADTVVEETPAKALNPRRNLNFASPEVQMAIIVDDDESGGGDDDDALIATIIDDSSESVHVGHEEPTKNADVVAEQRHLQQTPPSIAQTSPEPSNTKKSRVTKKSESSIAVDIPMKKSENAEVKSSKSVRSARNVPFVAQTSPDQSTKQMLSEEKSNNRNGLSRVSPTVTNKDKLYRQEGTVKRGRWILGAKIGVGSFGEVHVGMNTHSGVLMAVKRFRMEGAVMKDVRTEVELLRSLKHKNIVRYLGAQMDEIYLHIFQEWVPGGSVSSLLTKFGPFSVEVMQSYLSQTLAGLQYLHKMNIMHRDMKGSNILVNDEGVVKLADFGASKKLAHLEDDLLMSLTVRGTPYFMAPEVFEEKYSSKADVWGIGCVAYQMATSRPPWKEQGFTNPISLFNHIKKQKGGPPMQHPECNSFSTRQQKAWNLFEDMVRKCFDQDPSLRPTTSQLMNHPFFLIVHDDEDDDESVHRGLFSPGNETKSSLDFVRGSPEQRTNSSESSSNPKTLSAGTVSPPGKVTRSKSVVQWKTSFLSPPRQKKKQDKNSLTPFKASPQTPSQSPDTSEWPDWARAQLKKQNFSKKSSPKPVVSDLTNLMGSLALSEDSTSEALRFACKNNPRLSTIGTTTAHSKLVGLSLLEESTIEPAYEI